MSDDESKLCRKLSFVDCELAIIRSNVEKAEESRSQLLANSKEIMEMVEIVEEFLRKKRMICYGGTAINNILPKDEQFYNKELEIPDYDFYSPDAMADAKSLADIFHERGFAEIEAKAGIHYGTYKVFVNYISIADITFLHPTIFKSMSTEAIEMDGILYSPPNFLRMNMHLELSRPAGDISRWEKIYKRLTLLNDNYPFAAPANCAKVDFQRKMKNNKKTSSTLYTDIRDALIDNGVVFFGGYAARLYSRHMSKDRKTIVHKIPDFDVISDDYEHCANILIERLKTKGHDASKRSHAAIGEIIPERIEIMVGVETMAFIYKPIACHNYNVIKVDNRELKVATIDTMLSFYLAFYYSDQPYYSKDRLLCMSKFLFELQFEAQREHKGLLKRFSMDCYGTQPTLESIREEKMKKFEELKDKRGTVEYDEWFLKYVPKKSKMETDKPKTKKRALPPKKKKKHAKTVKRKSNGW